ncbi:ATP-binding cassette domain-containing protein, partial [Candidatus Babeliales bacterium]|nr:ATP-binding cassette domain-containing protein [Candidatus Babeliales bacterium]
LEDQLFQLNKQKKGVHQSLMKEQKRAAQSKKKGLKNIREKKWTPLAAGQKTMDAEKVTGKRTSDMSEKSAKLREQLSDLYIEEEILPTFSLPAGVSNKTVISIMQGTVGYQEGKPLVTGISFSLGAGERAVLSGDNGSGKSTVVKALLGNKEVITTGIWSGVKSEQIGYLDQNYGTLKQDTTVFETIKDAVFEWDDKKIRSHLNDFLFRKNEEVQKTVKMLSGGERVRLCLAQIAAKTPELLILDEITNNIDLETREHVIQVLKKYPGALFVISHDQDFLDQMDITDCYEIKNGIFSFKV